MKRILIFSLAYHPRFVGGAEVAIKEITDRIAPEEIEFHLVTLRFDSMLPKTEQIGNVLVHRIGWARKQPSIADLQKPFFKLVKYWYQFGAAFHALLLHRTYRFDGVWAMMAHSAGVPVAVFSLLSPKTPYLLTLQEGDPLDHIERSMWPVWLLFVRAFTHAAQVQAISTFLAQWATRMGFTGTPAVVPNGVDIARFTAHIPETEIKTLRSSLHIQSTDTLLLHMGRMVEKNGLDTIIDALTLLPSSVHFLQVGDGPLAGALKARAVEKGVSNRFHMVPYVPQEKLPAYLAISDIFIRPSRSEGMGNVFVEAMAAGLPVIGTQEGGIADFLFDAKRNPDTKATGFAVDVNAPQQIADMVTYIQTHVEEVAETTARAKRMVAEQYDWDHVAKRMHEIFVNLAHV